MKKYEKNSLIKFTSIYFLSTAIFILIFGYLYFSQQKTNILQNNAMKMRQYVMSLKQTSFNYKEEGYSFEIGEKVDLKFQLPIKKDNYYYKIFPIAMGENHILVKQDANIIDTEIINIRKYVITIQICMLLVFLFISFILAKISLKPMNDTISHLDRFIKDLVHDLNTPSTSILLNSKMLQKDVEGEKALRKLNRIELSAKSIASLYENLEILLNKNLQKSEINIFNLITELIENYKILYPNIEINIENKDMIVLSNDKAIYRILDNILSNACKYSSENPKVDILFHNNKLIIKDNGKGMKFPQKIFERSYTENELGHGIGMHIVHRLALELDIKINIDSVEDKGTIIELIFTKG